MSRTTCSTCGARLAATARFCPECGVRLAGEPAAPEIRTFGKPPSAPPGLVRRLAAVRIRGRAAVEALAVQSQARRELLAIRLQLEQLAGERGDRLRELGEAVYADDAAAGAAARAAVRELDDRIAAKEAQMTEIAARAQARVEQVRAESGPTVLIEPPPPPDESDTSRPI